MWSKQPLEPLPPLTPPPPRSGGREKKGGGGEGGSKRGRAVVGLVTIDTIPWIAHRLEDSLQVLQKGESTTKHCKKDDSC